MTQEKYQYSAVKEKELIKRANQIANQHKFDSLLDIFKIDLQDLHIVEKFFITTCVLCIHKNGYLKIENIDCDEGKSYIGGLVELNDKFKNKVIENLTSVEFLSIYPSLILNHKEEICNIEGFKSVYEDIFNSYRELSIEDKKQDHAQEAKKYMNMVFGMLGSSCPDSYFKSKINLSSITLKAKMILKSLISKFEGHWVYADTDSIYFARYEEIEFRLEEELNKIMDRYNYLKADVEIHGYGIFIAKKKFLLVERDCSRKVKGLRIVS